jgi:uncharacterized protein HemY
MRGLNIFTVMHLLIAAVFCGNSIVGYVGNMYIEGGVPTLTAFFVIVTVPWTYIAFMMIIRD